MPFVSITRLRVRRWRYLPHFLFQSIRAARQAKRASGSIAVSILRDADRAFWTRTVWRVVAAIIAVASSPLSGKEHRSREVTREFQREHPYVLQVAEPAAVAPAIARITSSRSPVADRMPFQTCNGRLSRMRELRMRELRIGASSGLGW
jgi:hypothetical protein